MRRAFVVVIDACGAGPLPDSAAYGDAGANTLGHLAAVTGGLSLPTLARLGLGSILPLDGVPPAEDPVVHGQLRPLGVGKDSTAGHWELMGVVQTESPPRYPNGFPPEVIDVVVAAGHRPVVCNHACNGIEAIDDYGAEGLRRGALIVYTSQDSVLQIAAHERVATQDELHAICRFVRERLPPEHAVGRVIARPFRGEPGAFRRTEGRYDYALVPGHSYLDELQRAGIPVHTVGKVGQLFAGVRDRRTASGSDECDRPRADIPADRRAPARLRIHEPDRNGPGLRSPARRRGVPRRVCRRSIGPSPDGSRCSGLTISSC